MPTTASDGIDKGLQTAETIKQQRRNSRNHQLRVQQAEQTLEANELKLRSAQRKDELDDRKFQAIVKDLDAQREYDMLVKARDEFDTAMNSDDLENLFDTFSDNENVRTLMGDRVMINNQAITGMLKFDINNPDHLDGMFQDLEKEGISKEMWDAASQEQKDKYISGLVVGMNASNQMDVINRADIGVIMGNDNRHAKARRRHREWDNNLDSLRNEQTVPAPTNIPTSDNVQDIEHTMRVLAGYPENERSNLMQFLKVAEPGKYAEIIKKEQEAITEGATRPGKVSEAEAKAREAVAKASEAETAAFVAFQTIDAQIEQARNEAEKSGQPGGSRGNQYTDKRDDYNAASAALEEAFPNGPTDINTWTTEQSEAYGRYMTAASLHSPKTFPDKDTRKRDLRLQNSRAAREFAYESLSPENVGWFDATLEIIGARTNEYNVPGTAFRIGNKVESIALASDVQGNGRLNYRAVADLEDSADSSPFKTHTAISAGLVSSTKLLLGQEINNYNVDKGVLDEKYMEYVRLPALKEAAFGAIYSYDRFTRDQQKLNNEDVTGYTFTLPSRGDEQLTMESFINDNGEIEMTEKEVVEIYDLINPATAKGVQERLLQSTKSQDTNSSTGSKSSIPIPGTSTTNTSNEGFDPSQGNKALGGTE